MEPRGPTKEGLGAGWLGWEQGHQSELLWAELPKPEGQADSGLDAVEDPSVGSASALTVTVASAQRLT